MQQIVLVAKTEIDPKESLTILVRKGKSIAQCINKEETKYMKVNSEDRRRWLMNKTMGVFNFESAAPLNI